MQLTFSLSEKATRAAKSSCLMSSETVLDPNEVPPFPAGESNASELLLQAFPAEQSRLSKAALLRLAAVHELTGGDVDLLYLITLLELPSESVLPSSRSNDENAQFLWTARAESSQQPATAAGR